MEIVENANPAHFLLAYAVTSYVLNRGFHPGHIEIPKEIRHVAKQNRFHRNFTNERDNRFGN